MFILGGILFFYLLSTIKVLRKHEEGVMFRLGRLQPEPKGPGLALVFWPIYKMERVSLATMTMDVQAKGAITLDNVSVKVHAIVRFRIFDANRAVVMVENYLNATSQLVRNTLRSVMGEFKLDEVLSMPEKLNEHLLTILDQSTETWGIDVSMVEVKAVEPSPKRELGGES